MPANPERHKDRQDTQMHSPSLRRSLDADMLRLICSDVKMTFPRLSSLQTLLNGLLCPPSRTRQERCLCFADGEALLGESTPFTEDRVREAWGKASFSAKAFRRRLHRHNQSHP